MSVSQILDPVTKKISTQYLLPPPSKFQDVSLPILSLAAGNNTIAYDFTPTFFQYNKHYLIGWTTLFTETAPGTTGSIKWGISQNTLPLVLPLLSQESTQIIDLSTQLTLPNGGQTIQSVCASFLTETVDGVTPCPPNITLWFEGTGLSAPVDVQVREAFLIKQD